MRPASPQQVRSHAASRAAVALMCAWVSATASASAASACSFMSGRFSSNRTMCWTCSLSAAPRPTSDCLITRGAYSLIGMRRRTTVASAAPRAWPSFSAEVADLSMNTVSIATCCGCHSSSSRLQPFAQQAQARREILRIEQLQRLRMHERAAAVGGDIDDAEAGALRTGVDPEDSGSRRQLTPIRRRHPRRGRRWSRRSGRRPCLPASAAA